MFVARFVRFARHSLGKIMLLSLMLVSVHAHATIVRLQTTQGVIEIQLYDQATPITVANFMAYVRSGAYNDSMFHRSVPGFVIQGGGYTWNSTTNLPVEVPSRGPIKNEFNVARSNLRGTIAMAKLGGDPDSATSQWFINLVDNSSTLNIQNGGFTVFGQVSAASMAVVDAIAALQIVNEGSPFDALPITSPRSGNNYVKANLSLVNSIAITAGAVPAGVIDIDGSGRHNVVLRSTSGTPQMRVGRLVGNQFQFTTQDDPGANFRLAAVADLDGNGKSDLVFLNTTQGEFSDVRIWTDFQRSTERLWRQVKQVWDVQVVGDLDGDGSADLVWRYLAADPRDTGVSYVWFYNGANAPVVRKRGGAPLDWTLLGAADLNADGSADMVYVSPANEIRVLMATPNRTCANLRAGSVPSGYRVLRMADFSGTGRSDIFIRNFTTGQNALLSLNATGLSLPEFTGSPDDPNASCTASSLALTVVPLGLEQTDPTWKFYAAGDFNADGRSDIAWLKPDGTLTLWLFNTGFLAPTVINNAGSAPAGFTVYQAGGGGAVY